MDAILQLIIVASGGSLIWIISSVFTGGKYANRLEQVEKVAHSSPCDEINDIKVSIERIETNVVWLVKENGGEPE